MLQVSRGTPHEHKASLLGVGLCTPLPARPEQEEGCLRRGPQAATDKLRYARMNTDFRHFAFVFICVDPCSSVVETHACGRPRGGAQGRWPLPVPLPQREGSLNSCGAPTCPQPVASPAGPGHIAALRRATAIIGEVFVDASSLLVFAGALIVAAGSPGPSIAALVARVLAKGWRDVLPFLAAMWVGEAIWLSLAVFGLAVVAQSFHLLFVVIKYLGVGYLLYLAWKMWSAPVAEGDGALPRERSAGKLFLAGMAVTLGNPKIMVFYLALLPTIIDLTRVSALGWAELTATMLAVLIGVDLAWVVLAAQARRLLRSARAMRAANRTSATVMAGAAAAIAAR